MPNLLIKEWTASNQPVDESQVQHITEIIHWLIESARSRELITCLPNHENVLRPHSCREGK